MKKRFSLIPLVLLIASFLPTNTLAATGVCDGSHTPANWHAGFSLNGNFNGVRSYIQPYDAGPAFGYCGPSNQNFAAAYVALVPNVNNPQYGNLNAIVQIGVIKGNCTNCGDTNGKVRYAVAWGGCGGKQPYWQVVGNPVFAGNHRYWIDKGTGTSTGWLYAHVDSTLMWQWSPSDPDITCWTTHEMGGSYNGERVDHQDSLGSLGINEDLWFKSVDYKNPLNSWIHLDMQPPFCTETEYDTNCYIYSQDPGYNDGIHMNTP